MTRRLIDANGNPFEPLQEPATVRRVNLEIAGPRQSFFRCPVDNRKLTVRAAYPFMWSYKRCPKCGCVWTLVDPYLGVEDWRRSDDDLLVGYRQEIRIFAHTDPGREINDTERR